MKPSRVHEALYALLTALAEIGCTGDVQERLEAVKWLGDQGWGKAPVGRALIRTDPDV